MTTLTHLQQNFVEIRTDPANNDMADYVCYRKAGYSAPTNAVATAGAARLLATVSVATAITKIMARRQARREERIAVTAQWAQQRLLDLYERNLAQNDLAEARRTVGDLAKLCDLYPRHDASTTPSSVTNVVNLLADASPSDVLALFRGEPPALPPGGDDIGRGAVEHMPICRYVV